MNQNRIKQFVLIPALLLVIGAGCGKAATNTNTTAVNDATVNTNEAAEEIDTSDWLTYENEEYGFSIQHPDDWYIQKKEPFSEGVLSTRFLSPEAVKIQNLPNYTDQPLGFEILVIETDLDTDDYMYDQMGEFLLDYSSIEIKNSRLRGVAFHEPGLAEGAFRHLFQIDNRIIDVRTFSENSVKSQLFLEFLNSLQAFDR